MGILGVERTIKIKPFPHNAGSWQTDKWTDTLRQHTSSLCIMSPA